MEKLTPPTDGHNTTGNINPSIHGFDGAYGWHSVKRWLFTSIHTTYTYFSGPIETSLTGTLFPGDDRIFNTTSLLPHEFPFNEDYNSGDTIGIG